MRILVIEDDPGGRTMLAQGLAECGHEAVCAPDFAEGLALAQAEGFDALIVDRMLPGGDGLNIVTALRAQGILTPAVFLTALNEVDDRIAGLRAGGDDYISKPFSFHELLARLEAIIRRKQPAPDTVLRVGDLEVNLISRTVKRGGLEIVLQPREFRLLEFPDAARRADRHPQHASRRRVEIPLRARNKDYRRANEPPAPKDRQGLRNASHPNRAGLWVLHLCGLGFVIPPPSG